jgi:hypothetical protein
MGTSGGGGDTVAVALDAGLVARVAALAGGGEGVPAWVARAVEDRLAAAGDAPPEVDLGLGAGVEEVRALAAAAPQRPDEQLLRFLADLKDDELRELWRRRVEPMWREAGRELADRHAGAPSGGTPGA